MHSIPRADRGFPKQRFANAPHDDADDSDERNPVEDSPGFDAAWLFGSSSAKGCATRSPFGSLGPKRAKSAERSSSGAFGLGDNCHFGPQTVVYSGGNSLSSKLMNRRFETGATFAAALGAQSSPSRALFPLRALSRTAAVEAPTRKGPLD
jgi:hypothetical protein